MEVRRAGDPPVNRIDQTETDLYVVLRSNNR